MKVTLFDYTGAGNLDPASYAAAVLLFTKSTRLQMSPTVLETFKALPMKDKIEQLKIMANTNPGSWEFINFSFLIEGVTRAFTHQLVRTRHASYAQQTMRVLEMENWTYGTGPSIAGTPTKEYLYDTTMKYIDHAYKELLKSGAAIEDARGVLPTNIHTNICMSINMRNWVNLIRKRVSARVQDEYQKVINFMTIEVEKVYPWIWIFVKSDEMEARKDLQYLIWENKKLTYEEQVAMVKKLDIIIKDL